MFTNCALCDIFNIMKYIVFLDIDGVLATQRTYYSHGGSYRFWVRFDSVAVDFMNKIHDQYKDVSFVLCSTWKNHLDAEDVTVRHWVESAFANSGFRGSLAKQWKTDPNNDFKYRTNGKTDRAHEVLEYLETYKPDDYIVFDDNRYRYNDVLPSRRLVLTDPNDGLLTKHMKNALSIMGTWEKK